MFYSIVLIVLIVFFIDEKIEWWEVLILIIIYFLYVIFMKYNYKIEKLVKRLFKLNKVSILDLK